MEECAKEISTIDWNLTIQFFSPIIVILLFGIERFLSFQIRKKEIEREWYFKVLIDPSLPKIDIFFKSCQNQFKIACVDLSGNTSLPHVDYLSLKSKNIGKFQKIKREFDTDIVTPINYRYPDVGYKLTNALLELEDLFSTYIDNEQISEDDQEDFISAVSELKASWLNILFEPISE